jgi:hypothetical protein
MNRGLQNNMTHSVLCTKMPSDRIDNNRRAMTATTDVRTTEGGKHKRPNHKFEERCSPRAEICTERNKKILCTNPAFPVRFGSVRQGPPRLLASPPPPPNSPKTHTWRILRQCSFGAYF